LNVQESELFRATEILMPNKRHLCLYQRS
jgi:hypothetical protein